MKIAEIIGAVLKALLGFFQQRRENDRSREQAERLAREAERAKIDLQSARENLDVAKNREKIDEAVSSLDNATALERLRAHVRPGT